jgi:predicted flap endonuclease-1-like 5' DNA nuclease
MWPFCSANSPLWFLLPLLLGLLTGWWAWARSGGSIGSVGAGIGGTLGSAASGIAGAAGSVATGVADAAGSAVSGVAGAAGSVASGVAGVAGGVADAAGSAVSGVTGAAGSVAAGVAGVAAAGVATAAAVASTAKDAAGATASGLVDTAKAAGTTVKATASGGVAKVAATGAAAAAAIGIAAAVGDPDDLLKIKGIGPKLNGVLVGLGITRFDQIAAWTPGDVDKVDDHMPEFQGRIARDEWIPQAKLLSTGQNAEWERIYGTVKKVAGAAAGGAFALTAIGIPAAVGAADDLLQIKGIGPKLNKLLISLGVTRFDQMAAWGAGEIDKVDDHLGTFKNRITRDSWVEQAGLLARGAIAEFEAKFGKLDSENK